MSQSYTAEEVNQFVALMDKGLYIDGGPIEQMNIGVRALPNGYVGLVINLVANNGDIKMELDLLPQYREQVEAKYGKEKENI